MVELVEFWLNLVEFWLNLVEMVDFLVELVDFLVESLKWLKSPKLPDRAMPACNTWSNGPKSRVPALLPDLPGA